MSSEVVKHKKKFITMEYIIYELVNDTENKVLMEFAKLFNVTPTEITEQNKNRHLSDIRHLYCKLRYEMHGASYSTIAREIDRTHTTVKYGIMRVNNLIHVNEKKIVAMWNRAKNIMGYYL